MAAASQGPVASFFHRRRVKKAKKQAAALRRDLWARARHEAMRYGRKEAWFADVVAICLRDADTAAALSATGKKSGELLEQVASFQDPELRDEVTARSGAFAVDPQMHSWPLDRAFDRAVKARQERPEPQDVRVVDVLLGCFDPFEEELISPLFPDWTELRESLRAQVDPPEEGEA